MVFKKIIFQNRYVALETPSGPPPPFMANTILNFHFDYWHTSLRAITSAHSLNGLWLGDVDSSDSASECCEYNDVTRLRRTIFAIITWLLQSFSSPCLSFCRCWMWMLPIALVCWWDSKTYQRFVEEVFSEISILPEISPSFQNWTQFAKNNALLLIVAILNVSTRRIL